MCVHFTSALASYVCLPDLGHRRTGLFVGTSSQVDKKNNNTPKSGRILFVVLGEDADLRGSGGYVCMLRVGHMIGTAGPWAGST